MYDLFRRCSETCISSAPLCSPMSCGRLPHPWPCFPKGCGRILRAGWPRLSLPPPAHKPRARLCNASCQPIVLRSSRRESAPGPSWYHAVRSPCHASRVCQRSERDLVLSGGFTNFCLQWGEAEWRACSAEPLKFSVRKLPDASGIRLVYYLDQETARQRGRGGLVEDGGLDILYVKREPRLFGLPSPAIVFRPERGRGKFSFTRKSGEDVIFDRLLVDCLVGRASNFCKLASGYQLPARARIFSQIEASCLYEKKVRKRF